MSECITNYEKVEKLLEYYRLIDIDITGLELELKLEGVSGVSYDTENVNPNVNTSSSVENRLQREDKLKSDIFKLEVKKEQMRNMFKLLTAQEEKIIKLRYFEGKEWIDIADVLDVCVDTALRKRKEAINNKLIPFCLRYKLIKS